MPLISVFSHVRNDKNPQAVELETVLKKTIEAPKNPDLSALLDKIRLCTDKAERSLLKANLPGFTPSALCDGGHGQNHFIQHSGYLAFDIDGLTHQTAQILRDSLLKIPFIYFASLSVSGQGVWGLVPIIATNAAEHLQRFEALESDFSFNGIKLDAGCKDLTRFRFYSHDPDAKINPNATIYTRLKRTKPKPRPSTTPTNYKPTKSVLEQAMAYCEKRGKTFKKGDMHDSILVLCGFLIKKGISEQEADAFIRQNICNEITTNCISYPYTHWKTDFGIWK